MFSHFARTDRAVVSLNLLLLMLVAFLPVSCTTRCGGTPRTAPA
jgi:uncharacterized membrane protein